MRPSVECVRCRRRSILRPAGDGRRERTREFTPACGTPCTGESPPCDLPCRLANDESLGYGGCPPSRRQRSRSKTARSLRLPSMASPPCSTGRSSSCRFQRRCDCGCRWPTDVLRICEDHSPSAIDRGPSSLFLLRTVRRTTRSVRGRYEVRSSDIAGSSDSNQWRTFLRCWHARSAHTGSGETKRRARHAREPSASPSGRERAGDGPAGGMYARSSRRDHQAGAQYA
jgi:hypothetical protein